MTMTKRPLTEKQQKVLQFCVDFTEEHGHTPRLQDIADRFGFSSNTAALSHVRALERRGLMRIDGRRLAFNPARVRVTVEVLPEEVKP